MRRPRSSVEHLIKYKNEKIDALIELPNKGKQNAQGDGGDMQTELQNKTGENKKEGMHEKNLTTKELENAVLMRLLTRE